MKYYIYTNKTSTIISNCLNRQPYDYNGNTGNWINGVTLSLFIKKSATIINRYPEGDNFRVASWMELEEITKEDFEKAMGHAEIITHSQNTILAIRNKYS